MESEFNASEPATAPLDAHRRHPMNPQATRRLAATLGLAFLTLLPACAYHGPYESYPAQPGTRF